MSAVRLVVTLQIGQVFARGVPALSGVAVEVVIAISWFVSSVAVGAVPTWPAGNCSRKVAFTAFGKASRLPHIELAEAAPCGKDGEAQAVKLLKPRQVG